MWAYVQRNLTNHTSLLWVRFYPTKRTLTGGQGKWIKSDAYDAASETWYPLWTLDISVDVKLDDSSTEKKTVEEGDEVAKLEQDPVSNVSILAWCHSCLSFFRGFEGSSECP